jgi:hypothetical protein
MQGDIAFGSNANGRNFLSGSWGSLEYLWDMQEFLCLVRPSIDITHLRSSFV